jgi:hypothetical protein
VATREGPSQLDATSQSECPSGSPEADEAPTAAGDAKLIRKSGSIVKAMPAARERKAKRSSLMRSAPSEATMSS